MNRFLRISLSITRIALPLTFVIVLLTSAANVIPKSPDIDNTLYYTSEAGRFDITMPMPISLHEQTLLYSLDLHPYAQLADLSLDCHQLAAKDYGAVWFVIYCDYAEEVLAKLTANQILDYARDSAFTTGVHILKDETAISYDDRFAGRAFAYQLDMNEADALGKAYTDTYKARVYFANNRLYWIGALVTAENQDNRLNKIEPFLDSFYIENPV